MISPVHHRPCYELGFALGLFIGAGVIMFAIGTSVTIKLIEEYEYETGNSVFCCSAVHGELRPDPYP